MKPLNLRVFVFVLAAMIMACASDGGPSDGGNRNDPQLKVVNQTDERLFIGVNGGNLGSVGPHQTANYTMAPGRATLSASRSEGGLTITSRELDFSYDHIQEWTIFYEKDAGKFNTDTKPPEHMPK